MTNDGGIWEKPMENKLYMKIGEAEYNLDKVAEKTTEKYPDWKGGDAAAWNRTSKKGDDYLSITVKDDRYVAFKNGYKTKDNQPDWNVKKSVPLPKSE